MMTQPVRPPDTAGLPGGRTLYIVIVLHAFVELAVWITVLVVAFDRGGAAATGLAVAVQLLPAALLAPIVTAAGDRFDRRVVLVVGLGALALASAGLAIALAADLPLAVVYLFAAVFTIALGSTPGTVASLVVHHARSPRQLTDCNIGISLGRAAGSLVGPVATAILLAIVEPWAIAALCAATCASAAATAARRLPADDRPPSTIGIRSVLADSAQGIRYAVVTPAARRLIGFVALVGLLLGAFDVMFVAVAFDQLDRGGSTAAILNAVFAFGAVFVAIVASRRMPRTLTTATVAGTLLMTLPLLVLGGPDRVLPVAILIGVLGAGNGLVEIGSLTMLQRSCDEALTSRIFGLRDSALLVALSIGGAAAGQLIGDEVSARGLALVGLVAAAVLALVATSLRSVERGTTPASPDVVAALGHVAFLQPLPLPTVERLAAGADRRTVDAGVTIVRQGDPGDEFFVLLHGEVTIEVEGAPSVRAIAPASFGEVALLHDVARTATVSAATECRLAVIGRGPFLDALRRSTTGHQSALATAAQYRRAAGDDRSSTSAEQ
jgi:MFS family permease